MKVSTLVFDALCLSVLDAELDAPPTVSQEQKGLQCLQDVLAEHALTLPYRQRETFTNIKTLQHSGFEKVDAVDYVSQGQRYPLEDVELVEWNRRRTSTIHSTPDIYFFNPADTSIQVYPLPTNTGIFEVWGRKVNTPLRLTDELDPSLPSVFIAYLRYLTAFALCGSYNAPWTPERQAKLEGLAAAVTNQTIIDTESEPHYVYTNVAYGTNSLFSGRGWRL